MHLNCQEKLLHHGHWFKSAQTDFRFFIFYFNEHELGNNSCYISLLQSGPWFYFMIYSSGSFLLEAGWYQDAKKILDTSYKLCSTKEPEDCKIAAKLLTRYKELHLSVWLTYNKCLTYNKKESYLSYRELNKGSNERQGPPLGVCFTEVFIL